MKKIILGLCLLLVGAFAHAQGLENIIVEKYYVSNAADAAGSVGTLPTGSVTYRIYADMLPGYKFQAVYGIPAHTLKLTTSTSFFNNEDRGATTPTYTKTQARSNSVMLDSWVSVGGACAANFGVLKSEDDVTLGGATVVNQNSMLANNDASAGIPLTTQDGLWAGAPESVTTLGITTELGVFDATSQAGNSFITSNGSWASLNGSVGPTASNRVLIAQITTDGIFHYELNVQIGTPSGGTESYVALNPGAGEVSIASLMGTLGAPNAAPTVSITSPANGAGFVTGSNVAIAATAADADGTVTGVEFFVDGSSIGTDNTSPYTANYTSVTGTHNLTAKATDNNGAQTTSAVVTINVASNPAPTVSITAPTNGSSFVTGDVINITANATDNGSVASVEFFVDGSSIGTDVTAPYTASYTGVLGSHSLTAKATDNLGAAATSAAVNITVANNIAPTVSITAPANGSLYTAPAVVSITANANDADGTVALVEFFVNGLLVGSDATAPYTFNWTSVVGSAVLTAKATDNRGAVKTSAAVTISVADPNALPYKVVTTNSTCLPSSFCVPVAATDSVKNIIGYDVVMQYNPAKVTPTGVITVYSDLINPSYVDAINSIDAANGLITISLYFNITAPANTNFHGKGNVFCVEFNKAAAFNYVDTANFSIVSLQESYFTGVSAKLADAGKFTTYKDTTFNGQLEFWLDNSPIKYDAANPSAYVITNIYGNNATCTSLSAEAVQPNLNGRFSYNTQNGLNVSIQKDIPATTDVQAVINGFDALQVNKVLLNNASFLPSVYQIIAMDVNLDGVVSAGDASQINQRAVLFIPEFRQAWNYNANGVSNGQASKDWLFIDSSATLTGAAYHISATYPLNDGLGYSKSRVPVVPFCLPVPVTNVTDCPLIKTENYKSILVGDVDGNYALVANNAFRINGTDKVVFDLSKAVATNGYVDVPVSIETSESVNALDFSLQYNENTMKFNSIIDPSNSLQALAHMNADDHTLRFTSNSIEKYDVSKSVVMVRFATGNAAITESDLKSVKAYVNGSPVAAEVKSARISAENVAMVNVYPNPANGILNVEVSEDATIQLMDVDGREVLIQTNVLANEKQEINIQSLANGVYLLKVYNAGFVSIKKVVVN